MHAHPSAYDIRLAALVIVYAGNGVSVGVDNCGPAKGPACSVTEYAAGTYHRYQVKIIDSTSQSLVDQVI